MCEPDQLQIISYNQSQSVVAHYKGLPESAKIVSPGYFIFETAKVIKALQRKYKDADIVKISWPATSKINFVDENNKNPHNEAPKTLNNLASSIPPQSMLIKFNDKNRVQFLKREGTKVVMQVDGVTPVTENAKTLIEIDQEELLRGKVDMELADADYITYHFENDNFYCKSGGFNPKGDDGRTDDVEVDLFEGEPLEKTLPKLFLSLLDQLPGTVEIQGQQDKKPVTVSQWNERDEIHYAVMENKKRE